MPDLVFPSPFVVCIALWRKPFVFARYKINQCQVTDVPDHSKWIQCTIEKVDFSETSRSYLAKILYYRIRKPKCSAFINFEVGTMNVYVFFYSSATLSRCTMRSRVYLVKSAKRWFSSSCKNRIFDPKCLLTMRTLFKNQGVLRVLMESRISPCDRDIRCLLSRFIASVS